MRRGYCLGEGKRCVSEDQCTNCAFGKCIQLAKETDSEGFSYSKTPNGTTSCNLCTLEQLSTLQTEAHWAVYKKSGDSRVALPICLSSLIVVTKVFTLLSIQLYRPCTP